MHRERRVDGALSVILVRQGSAEDRHDGVTDVLVDRAFVAADLACELVEVRPEDAAKLLGVEPLAERRRTRKIREQDGDDLALLAEIPEFRVGDLKRRAFARGPRGRPGHLVQRRAA